ncbi:hypothetical protein [Actinoplanes sp. NPDC049118]|uniref:hypothetical protein n=1 Tax=Actinoplanes sp. NPDC049118 TaxID=3155769 RepID=UPI0033CD3C36
MRRSGFSSLAMMSGWLFADLLLVLFLTVLSSTAAGTPGTAPGESPSPSVSPSRSPSPSPSSSASARPRCPQSFDLKPQTFVVENVSLSGLAGRSAAARSRLVGEIRDQIREKGLQNQYAGMVLAFGFAPNANRALARKAALAAGLMLRDALPGFASVQVREFSYESDATNRVSLDVYFFVRC